MLSSIAFETVGGSRERTSGASLRVVVGYERDEDLPRLHDAVAGLGGSVMDIDTELKFFAVTGLGGRDRVFQLLSPVVPLRYVEEDIKSVRLLFTPNDPSYSVNQWAPQRIDAPQAWDIIRGINRTVVAVLDTGVDYNHEDLAANMWTDASGRRGYDFANADADPMDDQNTMPNPLTGICEPADIYHGTHVAGIIGAVMNNRKGIAGLAQVSIMAVKVLDDCGMGFPTHIAQGIRYAADRGARIVSLSLGAAADLSFLRDAVTYAWRKGVLIVAASGNDGGLVSYPAAYPSVVAVGSTDRSDFQSSFSNFGSALDLVAPGEDIYSTMKVWPYYQSHTGTSQAAPHVAGVAALALSRNPSLTNGQVADILNSTATDLGPPGWDSNYGRGLVNAYRAVEEALPLGLNASVIDVLGVVGIVNTTVTLSATLLQPGLGPIVGRPLDFAVDSESVGSAVTDYSGIAEVSYRLPPDWGEHTLEVNFAGDSSYVGSSGSASVHATVSDNGNIVGVVFSYESNERIPLATVFLPAGHIVTPADERGEFLIRYVPAGTWTITVQRSGYQVTYIDARVSAGETTVLAVKLRSEGGLPEAIEAMPVALFLTGVALVLAVVAVFVISRRRAIAMGRLPPPPEVPPQVASWLSRSHGVDAGRFTVIEAMPVADGHQLALMENVTGEIVIVRLDGRGRPVYLFLPQGGLRT